MIQSAWSSFAAEHRCKAIAAKAVNKIAEAVTDRCGEKFSDGADLVMEVVSASDLGRDRETKRDEYARAGIPEYWVVDPEDSTLTVLVLEDQRYREHNVYRSGERAASPLLDGFVIDVDRALAGH